MREWLQDDLSLEAVMLGSSLFQRCMTADKSLDTLVKQQRWVVTDMQGARYLRCSPPARHLPRYMVDSPCEEGELLQCQQIRRDIQDGLVTMVACIVIAHKFCGKPYTRMGIGTRSAASLALDIDDVNGMEVEFRIMRLLGCRICQTVPVEEDLDDLKVIEQEEQEARRTASAVARSINAGAGLLVDISG
jgi:hypothetical protein